MEVSKLLAGINAPVTTAPPPTTPWGADGSWQNTVADLKRQVDSLVAAHSSNPLQSSNNSQCVALAPSIYLSSAPSVQNVLPSSSKLPSPDIPAKEGTTDSLLSRPGKLAGHVSTETREKIWKGDFVDIFSLIRAKRREIEGKEKEPKSSSYSERKPKIEENITNWLFGFNVFMSMLLEKKPELGTSLIYYANKILKAQHTYGGLAWLEYNKDFRWAKVEDPSIGWDQTEVNVWLECVNNKVPGRQPFRPQLSGEKKGSCWAFNRKTCSRPAGTCKFKKAVPFVDTLPILNPNVLRNLKNGVGTSVNHQIDPPLPSPIRIEALRPWLQAYPSLDAASELTDLHHQLGEALSRRKDRNDKMSQKRGAKERDICVGDMVLVKCRKGGSKFVLPFEQDPWMVSDVKGTMITAKRGSEAITQNISFYKKVHAPDFQVPKDISSCDIIDQDYDDIALQDPCLETSDTFSGRVMCPEMQIPDDRVVLDHGTCQSVPMGSEVPNSGNYLVMEPTTSGPGVAGSVTSNRGDGPYNLRPRPQCSTRLRGFVLN
ncbi:hypothetical protein NDU88_003173 [Pleurodeles waltl]|uniref:Uncharacterized protein n=1 Tax=Pleurodeles waltl TaxID=8319 RepID=A0AAV7QC18_PLEWA|nr:hypothetical protein NDU88_003173 [Pleurodeles waltl]